jgi:hypothetical protein
MESRRRRCKLHSFLIIIFCILSVNQLSYSQINIQERVEIAPQQISAGHAVANGNNSSVDSIVVSIVAHLHYTAGAVLSIDPTPVYPAYPVALAKITVRYFNY